MPCNEEWGAGTRHVQMLRETFSRDIRLASAASELAAIWVDYDYGADIKADIGFHFVQRETA